MPDRLKLSQTGTNYGHLQKLRKSGTKQCLHYVIIQSMRSFNLSEKKIVMVLNYMFYKNSTCVYSKTSSTPPPPFSPSLPLSSKKKEKKETKTKQKQSSN